MSQGQCQKCKLWKDARYVHVCPSEWFVCFEECEDIADWSMSYGTDEETAAASFVDKHDDGGMQEDEGIEVFVRRTFSSPSIKIRVVKYIRVVYSGKVSR